LQKRVGYLEDFSKEIKEIKDAKEAKNQKVKIDFEYNFTASNIGGKNASN